MKCWTRDAMTFAAACGILLGTILATGCASGPAATSRRFDSAAMINPRLAPQWAQYLAGPLSRVATDAEIDEFLALSDDDSASAFVDRFWASRDPRPDREGNALRTLYDERIAEADRRFSQAGYLGRRTDRGTIFVLHGEPDEMDFEPNPQGRGDLVEVWRYKPSSTRISLNRRPPDQIYRFLQVGDLKVFYVTSTLRQAPQRPF